ncbi:hypothetical protein [Amphritea balenae]|uniref:DUF5610 domain-containing protein n=1 Tax=Amphritea balenae TaxID=452629 RepID=A0A3P1SS04_9GAMM|nr:hypothetical protein [Amphritea balenae]RRC99963.1 hypothetical protein EHS89_07035 [Amphritea balenae]GGK75407.1 hypothetical protein GCM10007941_26950 [Amphritea balenae]
MFNSVNFSPLTQFQQQFPTNQSNHSHRSESLTEQRAEQSVGQKVGQTGFQSSYLSERFSNKESFSVSLMTREGDRVEINFSSVEKYQAEYASRQTGSSSSEFMSIDRSSASQFGFSVQGDLSVEEIDAISSLVQDLSQVADEFFNGDLQSATQLAGDLSLDSGQLMSLDMSMQQSMKYRAVEQYRQVQEMSDQHQSGRAMMPYLQQMAHQVEQTSQIIHQASEFSFSLLNELIVRDQRAADLVQPEALEGTLDQIQTLVEQLVTQSGYLSASEQQTEAEV